MKGDAMKLWEFLQTLDDKLDAKGISSFDVEVCIQEVEGKPQFDLLLYRIDNGKYIGKVRF